MEPGKNDDFVSVAIRIRPQISPETSHRNCINVVSTDPATIQICDKPQCYSFDHIFTEESEQHQVYDEIVRPMVDRVIEGYNSTVFAYGQTGTGKTYTIGTDSERYIEKDDGLITRTLNDILSKSDEDQEVSISISFCEIYNEKVYDLLANTKAVLPIKGLNVVGLSYHQIKDVFEAQLLLQKGGKNRHTGETRQNSNSSRSHAIFTIYCKVAHLNHKMESKLNLVDLAGSESIKKTGNEGSQLFEGININKGLLCIGQVINALSCNRTFVPYRQSTITTMLQDSLNKNNYVSLIACVVRNIEDAHETIQTLDFAQRAKRMKNRPELNVLKPNDRLLNMNRVKGTPRASYTLSGRKKFSFKAPNKVCSTPLHRQPLPVYSEMENYDYEAHLSMSSISSNAASDCQIDLSPIVRKCVDAVQTNILEKLESMMAETMSKSLMPNTPRIPEVELISTVTNIVRQELTLFPEINGTFRKRNALKLLSCEATMTNNHDSPKLFGFKDGIAIRQQNADVETSPIFKMPEILPSRLKNFPRRSVKTSSPIHVRRSVRLSLKQRTPDHFAKRCSTRRSEKLQQQVTTPVHSSRRSAKLQQQVATPVPVPRPRTKVPCKRISKPPTAAPRKSLVKYNMSNTKKILHVLNTGKVDDFCEFNTIGRKTAHMLHEYRQMRGKFSKISDLEVMPWRGNGYQRFLEANFLINM